MNVMTDVVRGAVRLGLLTGAIVFAGVGIGQESLPASASSHTQILISLSPISPIHAPAIVVNPDGQPRDLYAWVVDVDEPSGASGYHLEIGFDSSVLTAAGGSRQVDIIDGLVDANESGIIDDDDDLFNVLLPLAASGSDRVNIINGQVDADQSGAITFGDIVADALLLLPVGGSSQVDIINGQVDVDQSGTVDAADDLADALILTVTGMAPDSPMWLDNGGRIGACPSPVIEADRAYIDCLTVGQPPPFGATGTGLLGKLTLFPGSNWQTTSLNLAGSFLLDTPPDLELTIIPVTVQPTSVIFTHCADFNGDGNVDLFGDILGVVLQFGKTSEDPDWDPIFDINKNGEIGLFDDILNTILQFGLPCTQPA